MDAKERTALRKSLRRLGIIYFVLTAYFAAHMIRDMYLYLRSRPVAARVTAVGVEPHTTPRGRTLYWPSVVFVYRENGVEHEGTRYRAEPGPAADRATAEGLANAFHVGQEVTAYAIPGDYSASAFLRREVPLRAWGWLVVLAGFWIVLRYIIYPDRRINAKEGPPR